jgi:glutathione synthase/RimK-type ligase-like ATP-grasp enzyme
MSLKIAIHRDQPLDGGGAAVGNQAKPGWNLDIWANTARAYGHEIVWVDVFASDILQQLRGCDGFMWRCNHKPARLAIARRLLPVVERQLGLSVFPDTNTFWHYDDKISQSYALQAADVATPATWVFWDRDSAMDFAERSTYPLVIKLSAGASSSNVRLLTNRVELEFCINQVFDGGICRLTTMPRSNGRRLRSRIRAGLDGLFGKKKNQFNLGEFDQLHRDYIYLQEFVPENEFDTRVTIIGNRAFAYRRFNRPADFRASGSGDFNVDPEEIDLNAVKLAAEVAKKLRTQSLAVDVLHLNDRHVVIEVSYAFVGWMVQSCPGYWQIGDGFQEEELVWVDGQLSPEEAIIEDFLKKLDKREIRESCVERVDRTQ